MNPIQHLLLICIAIGCVRSAAVAEVIYKQTAPENPTADFTSIDIPGRQKVADNFVIEGGTPTTARSIRFIGGYGVNSPPPFTPPFDALPEDSFNVVFLGDDNGSPGTVIEDFRVQAVFRRRPTDGPLLGGMLSPVEYLIDLGEGVPLSPKVEYWISISNDPGPNHGWGWASAFGDFDQNLASTFNSVESGPWNVFQSGGMWFELSSRNIPEPSGVLLLVTAIGSMIIKQLFF